MKWTKGIKILFNQKLYSVLGKHAKVDFLMNTEANTLIIGPAHDSSSKAVKVKIRKNGGTKILRTKLASELIQMYGLDFNDKKCLDFQEIQCDKNDVFIDMTEYITLPDTDRNASAFEANSPKYFDTS